MKTIADFKTEGKRILIRSDLNVPIKNGKIQSYKRINSSLPTIKIALEKKAKVILCSHLGNPIEGSFQKKFSLKPIFHFIKKKLPQYSVYFSKNCKDAFKLKNSELLILENVRFNIGEKKNCSTLSKKYASLCDIFVMDAFGTAHRKHASTYGVAKYSKIKCAGLLLKNEIKMLSKSLKKPNRPMLAIIGGSKISTKFKILKKLAKLADNIIVGGGIANTFIAIKNDVGKSLHEKKYIKKAKILLKKHNIFFPIDSRVSTSFSIKAKSIVKNVSEIKKNEEIMDIGPQTERKIEKIINKSKTIIWNGPLGVFEFPNFRKGTEKLAKAISNKKCFSIAGGGDTISVIDMFRIKKNISYISTGGGAFLQFIENNTLPGIEILKK